METTLKFKGEITISLHEQRNPFLRFYNKSLEVLFHSGLISRQTLKKYYKLGDLIKTETKQNIICAPGLNVLARRLASDNTYTGNINYMALGSGTGAFDGTETQLYTEVYRNAAASYTAQNNIAYISAFYDQTEVTGNFTEFGNFIDGTGSANSGKLWSHISIAWAKTSIQTLTVDAKYTLISA